jgi:hypothetical protein
VDSRDGPSWLFGVRLAHDLGPTHAGPNLLVISSSFFFKAPLSSCRTKISVCRATILVRRAATPLVITLSFASC